MIRKYGVKFPDDYDDARIERHMIRNGGFWKQNGKEYGLGLFQHFKNYWSLLWPDDSQTRWTDLILKELLENQFLGIVGPASSWKTSTVARISLMDWSCFPDCTMVVMSSTDMEGLRSRVYGECSKMWGQAYSRFEWWPGFPVDYRCVIANEDIDEDDVRDVRNGIIGVPNKTSDGKVQGMGKFAGRKNTRVWAIADETQFCFPAGTLVDTVRGPRPIESISVGDEVYNLSGTGRVAATGSRKTNRLVVVNFENGRQVACTPEHPFYTQHGWIKAEALGPVHYCLSPWSSENPKPEWAESRGDWVWSVVSWILTGEDVAVYNLSVDGHPSYSVNGFLVHNCERSFLDAQNNLINNGPLLLPGLIRNPDGSPLLDSFGKEKPLRGYRAVFIGNPNPTRPENCLHLVCEPEGGWNSVPDDCKTKVWNAKQVPNNVVKCRVINLDGADSPNNDFPGDTPKWPQLINSKTIARYPKDSEAYWTQGRGMVKLGIAGLKIITRELCDQFHAFDGVTWDGAEKPKKIGMLDAAYGGVGGDRCACGWLEFGKCVDGVDRIFIHPYVEVPITIRDDMIPEDQIANFVKKKMTEVGVEPEDFFFDGRGSMAISLARIWSPMVNTVEFGGSPTERIAGPDLYIDDKDTGERRLKTAKEHYSKFVSELWWSWRYCIESNQIRGLQLDVVMDAAPREWSKAKGDKIEIESKRDMKKRTGCSPDLADMVAVGIEGARRRGFQIARLGAVEKKPRAIDLQRLAEEHSDFLSKRMLVNA